MYRKISFLLICCISMVTYSSSQPPRRVVLFMIDGLHWEAPQKLEMPVLNNLRKEGTFIQKSYMIVPHHPTIGDYSKYNSCSFPNPMLHAGSVFVKPENKYIQEVFRGSQTAFVVNTAAYRSVARGFTTQIMDPSLSDKQVVEQAMQILKNQDPVFMRVHLQTPGDIGSSIAVSTPGKPYFRNIFGEGSPYIKAIEEADVLLGQFVSFLKKEGLWNETVLVVTSDHGQGRTGWHPLFDEDSWATPLVFTGPGIAKGRELPYFEHTNLAPTIAWLLGKEAPNTDDGSGVAVHEIMANVNAGNYHPQMFLKILNQQLKEFAVLKSKMLLAAEDDPYLLYLLAALENEGLTPEPFYHQDRVTDWHKAGDFGHLVEANEKILGQMRESLK
ncbi:MAG: alkaline phosphatase family protein [Prolixibacteraceae bacterium]|nr:alkaline phosphatase family protein [Prolixibacteraceae bacterium]